MKTKGQHIIFVCTEDWFFRSHFIPLQEAGREEGHKTTLLCNKGEASGELAKSGLEISQVDFVRHDFHPFASLKLFWQLFSLIRKKKPDIVHFIALKPVLFGGLAALFSPDIAKVYHVTGLGTLSEGGSWLRSAARQIVFRLIAFFLRRPRSRLLVENPDDLAVMQGYGSIAENQVALLGGAGVNPDIFIALPPPDHDIPHIAYVGRMVWIKGVDILVEAQQRLYQKGIIVQLDLYGDPDPGDPRSVSSQSLEDWNALPYIKWHGRTKDILGVWKNADIAVVPTRTREGMPRAMLEAACCARPLIVTDVPGCRHFVRDNQEGYIVPPKDVEAMSQAIERLALDQKKCLEMGQAARFRVLDGFTESAVKIKIKQIYADLSRV